MPATATAHGMHIGGFFGPNASTRHSPQNATPALAAVVLGLLERMPAASIPHLLIPPALAFGVWS